MVMRDESANVLANDKAWLDLVNQTNKFIKERSSSIGKPSLISSVRKRLAWKPSSHDVNFASILTKINIGYRSVDGIPSRPISTNSGHAIAIKIDQEPIVQTRVVQPKC